MPTNSNHQALKAVLALRKIGYEPINIRQGVLKLAGTSQREVANALGVSRQTVSLHIAALRKNPEVVYGISKFLGVPPEDFFPDTAAWLRSVKFSA